MSADEDDEALAARLRLGEEEALGLLFWQCRPRLARMVQFRLDRRMAGRIDADDILQEAYLAALQRLEHFPREEGGSSYIWLRLIVMQTLVDVHRRHLGAQMRDAGREISLHGHADAGSTASSLAARLIGDQTSPSQAAMRAEATAELEIALSQMNEIDREVLALRHFEELSNNEVAEVLAIQPKAASIRYIRAVARLKTIMEDLNKSR